MKPVLKSANRAGMLFLCVAAGLLGGCRKDLCYNHFRQADIELDWEYAWERDYGCKWTTNWDVEKYGMEYTALLPKKQEGVTALFYDKTGKYSERFLTPDGGSHMLQEETSSLLLYNNNTEYIIFNFDNMSAGTSQPEDMRATSSTRTRSTMKALHEGERTVNPPDMLYGAFVSELPDIKLHESSTIPVTMRPLVYTYIIRYEFASGIEHVALARGALAGMAESVFLRDGRTDEKTATILFDCEKTEWGIQAIVKSFGVPGFPDAYYPKTADSEESNGQNYMLNLEVMFGSGKSKTYEFDITEQMQLQPRGGVIVVKNVIVWESEGGVDSGFWVNVEDWGENEDVIDLPIGVY